MNHFRLIGLAIFIGTGVAFTTMADETDILRTVVASSGKNITPVVELYTSEGCSSCPRADDFLTLLGENLNQDFHAVPLAFHVDYWNRLGWRDPYSQAKFTDRQRWIAMLNKQRSIYTPEIVVSGHETRGGEKVVGWINSRNREIADVQITLEVSTNAERKILADLGIQNRTNVDMPKMYFALYENNIVREIKGGENKGRTLTHNFLVRHLSETTHLAKGNTNRLISMDIDEEWNLNNLGLAVVVIDAANGQTLQSLRTPFPTLN